MMAFCLEEAIVAGTPLPAGEESAGLAEAVTKEEDEDDRERRLSLLQKNKRENSQYHAYFQDIIVVAGTV